MSEKPPPTTDPAPRASLGEPLADFWRRLRLQEPEAQAELYSHIGAVCPKVWRNLQVASNRHQDLAHDVFVSVMTLAEKRAEPPENLAGFLKGWAMDALTGGRRAPMPWKEIDPPDAGRGQEDLVHQAELLDAVRECVERLGRTRRQAFILHFLQELERKVAAQRAGVSVNAFAGRLFHASEAVRACLEKRGFRP